MPATVLERHYQDRVQSVRQLAQWWAGCLAPSGREFEDLVALCIQLSLSGKQLLETEFKRIFKKPDITVAWLQERRQAIEDLSDNVLDLVTFLKRKAYETSLTESPSEFDILGRLDEANRIIVEVRRHTLERWPIRSPRELAEARTAGSDGDYLDAHDAFAQIAGVDVAAWLNRLEKRKE